MAPAPQPEESARTRALLGSVARFFQHPTVSILIATLFTILGGIFFVLGLAWIVNADPDVSRGTQDSILHSSTPSERPYLGLLLAGHSLPRRRTHRPCTPQAEESRRRFPEKKKTPASTATLWKGLHRSHRDVSASLDHRRESGVLPGAAHLCRGRRTPSGPPCPVAPPRLDSSAVPPLTSCKNPRTNLATFFCSKPVLVQ
uniref:Integral membrane protein n=1 Tax=Steinernema glaseri TaxID=37863 RepID=A0A1I7ZTL1_9BILA